MDDFDIAQSKIGESAQRVVDRAIEETRRRDHTLLTNEHIFLAFAQVEWDTFSQVMRDLELNPARDPAGARGAPPRAADVRRTGAAGGAGHEARIQAGFPSGEPLRGGRRSSHPTCSKPSSRRARAFLFPSSDVMASSRRSS